VSIQVTSSSQPPQISATSGNQKTGAGGSALFTVTASGSGPIAYQWLFDGIGIVGATNNQLNLTNLQFTNAGVYTVVVSNAAGTTSSSTLLTVGASLGFYQTNHGLVLTWPPPYLLQSATNVVGPYFDVAGASSPYTNATGAGPRRFFRLRAGAAASLVPIGFSGGRFSFGGSGVPGYNYVIEASADLLNWVPIRTNAAPFQFTDPAASNYQARFYRSFFLQ
jgi:hypothetical protein